MRNQVLLIAALTAGTGLGHAQSIVPSLDEQGRRGEMARLMKEKTAKQFDGADENKDGKLSRAEVATISRYITENFDKRDADRDGLLSWEEYVGHNRWPR